MSRRVAQGFAQIAAVGGVKAAPPVKLKRGETVSYVDRALPGDRWEFDARFARWGRPVVLNANPPPQASLAQRIVARLGQLHDQAQWLQGRGPKPVNLPVRRPLYPPGSYGHTRGTKAYDRGGYRHGAKPDKAGLFGRIQIDSADRRYQTYMVPERNAQVMTDTRFAPFTEPYEAVIAPGSFRPWRDRTGARLAKEEGFFLDQPRPPSRRLALPRPPESVRLVPDPASVPVRVPVSRVLARAKMMKPAGRLQEVLARVAEALRGNPFKATPRVNSVGWADPAVFRQGGSPTVDAGMRRPLSARRDVRREPALRSLYRRGVANWVAGTAPAPYTARLNASWRDDTGQPLVRIPTPGERASYARQLQPVLRRHPELLAGQGRLMARVGHL